MAGRPGRRTRAVRRQVRRWSGQPWCGSAAIAGRAETASRSGTSAGTSRRATTLVRPAVARRTTRPRSAGTRRQVGQRVAPTRLDEGAGDVVSEGGDRLGPLAGAPLEGDDQVGDVGTVPGGGGVQRTSAAELGQGALVDAASGDDDLGRHPRGPQGPDDLVQLVTRGVHRDHPGSGGARHLRSSRGALGPHLDGADDVTAGLQEAGPQREDTVALLLVPGVQLEERAVEVVAGPLAEHVGLLPVLLGTAEHAAPVRRQGARRGRPRRPPRARRRGRRTEGRPGRRRRSWSRRARRRRLRAGRWRHRGAPGRTPSPRSPSPSRRGRGPGPAPVAGRRAVGCPGRAGRPGRPPARRR